MGALLILPTDEVDMRFSDGGCLRLVGYRRFKTSDKLRRLVTNQRYNRPCYSYNNVSRLIYGNFVKLNRILTSKNEVK